MRVTRYGRNNLRRSRRVIEGLGGSYTVRIYNATDAGVRGGKPDTVLETTLTGTKIEVLQKCCALQGRHDFYDVEAVANNLVELVVDWCGNDEDYQNEWFDEHATVEDCIRDLNCQDDCGGIYIMSVKDSKGRLVFESDLDFREENFEFEHPNGYYEEDDDEVLDEAVTEVKYTVIQTSDKSPVQEFSSNWRKAFDFMSGKPNLTLLKDGKWDAETDNRGLIHTFKLDHPSSPKSVREDRMNRRRVSESRKNKLKESELPDNLIEMAKEDGSFVGQNVVGIVEDGCIDSIDMILETEVDVYLYDSYVSNKHPEYEKEYKRAVYTAAYDYLVDHGLI